METPKIRAGETLIYRCDYGKRPGCSAIGDYRLLGYTNADPNVLVQFTFRPHTGGGWPVTTGSTIRQPIPVPKTIPAGRYDMFWIFNYDCKASGDWGATLRTVEVKLPKLPVEIVN